MTASYPAGAAQRNAWVRARRPPDRGFLDPRRPHAFFLEEERTSAGHRASVATVFLTNRECPWRCLMCDLWKGALAESVPAGAIPEQIDFALGRLGAARHIKLYNSGSFFDGRAIPPGDYPAIAARLREFERVIVECHPALVGEACLRFRDLLAGRLEVAMGLETAHPEALARLNKGMSLESFAAAAEMLRRNGMAMRAFILLRPPFLAEAEILPWALRSLEFAFDCGATAAVLIPTRLGNGALEALAENGEFSPPRLADLETALAQGLRLGRGRVFADLWDLERFSDCPHCFASRRDRLRAMNLDQAILPSVACGECGAGAHG